MPDVVMSPRGWGGPFVRKYSTDPLSPPIPTIDPQVGFELVGIKSALNEFCLSHQEVREKCTIGFFIFFSNDIGELVDSIEEIQVKKLEMVFSGESNAHWLTRLANADGHLKLDHASNVRVKGHRIFQYHRPGDNFGTPYTTAYNQPIVSLEDASGYALSEINGYQESLRIAYLDFGTLLHMLMSYNRVKEDGSNEHNVPEEKLKFIFTGAEIHHGELVSPFFQKERYADWTPDFLGLDPSITATLKMEGIYQNPDAESDYISAQAHPFHRAGTDNITLPGVKVLPPCRRFWHTVDRILSDASSQVELTNLTILSQRQEGVKKLSGMLTEDKLKELLGTVLGH